MDLITLLNAASDFTILVLFASVVLMGLFPRIRGILIKNLVDGEAALRPLDTIYKLIRSTVIAVDIVAEYTGADKFEYVYTLIKNAVTFFNIPVSDELLRNMIESTYQELKIQELLPSKRGLNDYS